MRIIQGQNTPIVLKFSEDTDFSLIKQLSCVLEENNETIKKYTLDDVVINDVEKTMTFPLSQEDTMKMKEKITFYCKLYDEDNIVLFLNKRTIRVIEWNDNTVFLKEGASNGI